MIDAHIKLFTLMANKELILGTARFAAPSAVSEKIIIVTGNDGKVRHLKAGRIYTDTDSKSIVPNIEGIDSVPYLPSSFMMELDSLPKSIGIVDGGYIALKFAQLLRRFGCAVTVLLRGNRFLPKEDLDISDDGIATDKHGNLTNKCATLCSPTPHWLEFELVVC